MKKYKEKQKGATLIEMIVAVAIFATAVLSATQIFQIGIQGQRKSMAAQNIQESMRYAFEVMDKEMRSAQKTEFGACGVGAGRIFALGGGNNTVSFGNVRGECVQYYLMGNTLVIDRDGRILPITPADIVVSNLFFTLTPFDAATQQGFVTIKLKVENVGMKEADRENMIIQTTIASRYYEES